MYICTQIQAFSLRNRKEMRFIGDYPAKTDAKGRAFLPAALRKALENEGEQRLVLRNDVFQHCLVLYPESVWNEQLDAMKARLNPMNGKHQMMLRQFVLDAEPIELDSNGRLLISKRKLQYAGIEGDVRFLAMDDRIEIWSKQALDDLAKENEGLGADLESMFG